MRRLAPLLIATAAALGCCAQAFALNSASASAAMTTRVVQSASVEIISPLVLPSVTAATVSPNGAVTTPGAGNASLTIRGQAGDTVSMAVPESFTVVRTGGTEALTVRTNTQAELGLEGDGVVLGGVMGSNTMSVNVGGALSLASAERLEPGAYEGLLVVVVQYN
ncbi:DUF4402 domain-containing protein [Phenylobacterium sp.]|uniref:DUF4402 domain-containing protein n=1 Tax=Phenylobacterium sp. TaxID=1871053 RepID=UPI0035B05F54